MHNNIMAAGSRDRPPMLATGRYAQWRSRFLRYIDTRPNGDALRKCILTGPYIPTMVTTPAVPATEDSPEVPAKTSVETVLNMTPENKAHYESEKEAIHLILTGIGDEIYSTVDACQTAQEMWEAIERLQQGESLNIQDVKTNLFWEFGQFTSHDGDESSFDFFLFSILLVLASREDLNSFHNFEAIYHAMLDASRNMEKRQAVRAVIGDPILLHMLSNFQEFINMSIGIVAGRSSYRRSGPKKSKPTTPPPPSSWASSAPVESEPKSGGFVANGVADATTPAPASSGSSVPVKSEPKSGGFVANMVATVADGFIWSTGNAMAHRAMDAIIGPRTIQIENVPAAAPAAFCCSCC
ncbi:hypothetical protein Tco_0365019 [Tanacetum coccineum]